MRYRLAFLLYIAVTMNIIPYGGSFHIKSAFAISPEEQLSDPILEERARALSSQLRCLVCQNQSIEDSDAELARDLRKEVRVKLQQGFDDELILKSLQNTYGDYILLRPPVNQTTYLLWLTPIILVLFAAFLFYHSFKPKRAEHIEVEKTNKQIYLADDVMPSMGRPKKAMLFLGAIFLASIGLYSFLGQPSLVSKPVAERVTERTEANAKRALELNKLKESFASAKHQASLTPESVEAQMSLALAAAQIQDFETEITSLRRALALTNDNPSIKAMLAEALSRQADGQITLPARALIDEALAVLPNEPRALFIKGLSAYQDERYLDAIAEWEQLQRTAPRDSIWPNLAAQNKQAAADAIGIQLPNDRAIVQEDDVAAMANATGEEQQEMISAMVAGLEMRLNDEPNDRQGWSMLIRAMGVLDDKQGLLRALSGNARAFPTERAAQLSFLEEMLAQGFDVTFLSEANEALERLNNLSPDTLEYLFFAGHLARAQGDIKSAMTLWQTLYDRLPDDAVFKPQIAKQISDLTPLK